VPALPRIQRARPGAARLVFSGRSTRDIALTFDDGFCAQCVARLIRGLEASGAHATLFPNGRYASAWTSQRAAIRRMVARRQIAIGNHTFSHADAVRESPAALRADLERNEAWIQRTFGVTARPLFRPPFGAYNSSTLQVAGSLGYTQVVMWSGTVADSSPRSIPYILNAIRYWSKPGRIILLHGNYPNTGIALPQILATLRHRHLHPVTVPELLQGDR
jgi:peptidoglycan/xylan/chitin deacetylase (PgdA/CDA1 family)